MIIVQDFFIIFVIMCSGFRVIFLVIAALLFGIVNIYGIGSILLCLTCLVI
jgi:hypothetical protein